jgi:choline dehydrogenase
VRGATGLRVVDLSVVPGPLSGNTNGPTMAIAARAADLILEDAARPA